MKLASDENKIGQGKKFIEKLGDRVKKIGSSFILKENMLNNYKGRQKMQYEIIVMKNHNLIIIST